MSGAYVQYEGTDCAMKLLEQYKPLTVAANRRPTSLKKGTGWLEGTAAELEAALIENLKYGRVLIEQYVRGREIDVGVLGDRALPSIEIIPKHGFYDYKNKYQAGATVEICPTPIDPAIEKRLGEAALKVHRALGLSAYSRSDFIVDGEEVYFLEINTLPGMTPTSLMPQEAAAVGVDYESLCKKVIEMALEETSA